MDRNQLEQRQRELEQRQLELHRLERAKYNLVHPVHGTISAFRARELWASRRMHMEGIEATPEEDAIIRYLWDQMDGSSCYMSAFFVFLNQEG